MVLSLSLFWSVYPVIDFDVLNVEYTTYHHKNSYIYHSRISTILGGSTKFWSFTIPKKVHAQKNLENYWQHVSFYFLFTIAIIYFDNKNPEQRGFKLNILQI